MNSTRFSIAFLLIQLEVSRLQCLEDALGIILLGDLLQLVVVRGAVAREDLLLGGSVVLVEEGIAEAHGVGGGVDSVHGVAGSGHDGGIIGFIRPGDCDVDY